MFLSATTAISLATVRAGLGVSGSAAAQAEAEAALREYEDSAAVAAMEDGGGGGGDGTETRWLADCYLAGYNATEKELEQLIGVSTSSNKRSNRKHTYGH